MSLTLLVFGIFLLIVWLYGLATGRYFGEYGWSDGYIYKDKQPIIFYLLSAFILGLGVFSLLVGLGIIPIDSIKKP